MRGVLATRTVLLSLGVEAHLKLSFLHKDLAQLQKNAMARLDTIELVEKAFEALGKVISQITELQRSRAEWEKMLEGVLRKAVSLLEKFGVLEVIQRVESDILHAEVETKRVKIELEKLA